MRAAMKKNIGTKRAMCYDISMIRRTPRKQT
jgi:hypothetical protein